MLWRLENGVSRDVYKCSRAKYYFTSMLPAEAHGTAIVWTWCCELNCRYGWHGWLGGCRVKTRVASVDRHLCILAAAQKVKSRSSIASYRKHLHQFSMRLRTLCRSRGNRTLRFEYANTCKTMQTHS